MDPKNFKGKPAETPAGLNNKDLKRWIEHQSGQYDYSFLRGKGLSTSIYQQLPRKQKKIIKSNKDLFAKLGNID
ncbi:hypothetical protein [Vibrio vulnificus]|uniref:hypothetical protein n=1 Tax=Vibrio vulnificus TaxID=672 RepID=UPI0010296B8D|nr:hypothetical protein [Vibrio vulnificus]ELI0611197.1 hypothetical protein [Vibrio vulnificus]MCU8273456.1 hypothetical protein [Vibrio vulnificus]RZQ08889.1 hypothetical protein D8T46_21925 [Vibrio vulnificus]HAS8338290.1 hypothetical protein [Vibrio vulnificus]